jgi:hypothetical protein
MHHLPLGVNLCKLLKILVSPYLLRMSIPKMVINQNHSIKRYRKKRLLIHRIVLAIRTIVLPVKVVVRMVESVDSVIISTSIKCTLLWSEYPNGIAWTARNQSVLPSKMLLNSKESVTNDAKSSKKGTSLMDHDLLVIAAMHDDHATHDLIHIVLPSRREICVSGR